MKYACLVYHEEQKLAALSEAESRRRSAMSSIVLVNANKYSESGVRADDELRAEMGKSNEQPATFEVLQAGERLQPGSTGQRTYPDYSEEAIPERDPAYRLPDGTLHDEQTVAVMPAGARAALARVLVQLGMNATRADLVASL